MALLEKILYLGLVVGFFCFSLIMKIGFTAAQEKYGTGFILVVGFGLIIGMLPIGFLIDIKRGRSRQRDDLP